MGSEGLPRVGMASLGAIENVAQSIPKKRSLSCTLPFPQPKPLTCARGVKAGLRGHMDAHMDTHMDTHSVETDTAWTDSTTSLYSLVPFPMHPRP